MRAFGRKAGTWLVIALLVALTARSQATSNPASTDLGVAEAVSRTQARAVERIGASVVSVRALASRTEEFGSGLIVTKEGALLTALHVVRGATTIAVRLEDGTEYPARLVARDRMADMALLRIKAPNRVFRAAAIGSDEQVRLGETVFVVGNPFGLGGSVTRGVLSARERRRVVPDNASGLLQTDAPINPGSSGAPLVNLRGEAIGLVTAILTRTGGHQGVGFAVPASELRHALRFMLKGEDVMRSWIGLKVRAAGGMEPGLVVVEAVLGGPGHKTGIEQGDVILRANGRRIESLGDLRSLLRRTAVGQPLRLGLRRGERRLDVWLATADRPAP